MNTVIIFPRGQLSEWDKDQALAAGIVVMEADDPSKVIQMIPAPPMFSADDLLLSALHAVRYGNEGQKFATELHTRLLKRETDKQDSMAAGSRVGTGG